MELILLSYVAIPLPRWTEITMIYTIWGLSHLHSGQVLQWGWGLDTQPTCCGDLLGLGGPVTQSKLNFSIFGVFALLSCAKEIAQPFHSIPLPRQVNGVLCSLFCLCKKISFFAEEAQPQWYSWVSISLFFLTSAPGPDTFLTVSALLACAVRTQILPVRMKTVV